MSSSSHVDQNSQDDRSSNNASQLNDLFYEEASHQTGRSPKPWWKSQFFVVEPVLFGTWDGVFTSCLINIFGVVLFLRTGWMVGNVGIGLAMLIVVITVSVSFLASVSAIGVCERIKNMGTGGVYALVSRVLGGKLGGTIGIMYAFGLSVVSALYCTGFAESVTETFQWNNAWAVRGVAIGTLLLLLAINLAGVKWVIRLQLVLLLVLLISTCDFIIGTFVHTNPEAGFVGYSSEVMRNNSSPALQSGETFFTVFGVFFPTATGVMAGVNMSGDLKTPSKSIPVGTLSALSISFILYIVFVLLLGSTCLRDALQLDFMIAEKVSAVGVLWLLGVYMSSTSSCSTGLYGAPRVLQSIANENVIPAVKFLGKGFGPNKTPVLAICVVGFISLLFILIGNLNVISPVITCIFMLVYASVDYAYFALAMSYDLNIKNFSKYKDEKPAKKRSFKVRHNMYGSMDDHQLPPGTMVEFTKDLDNLFKNSKNYKEDGGETSEEKRGDTPPLTEKEYLHQSYNLHDRETTQAKNSEEKGTERDSALPGKQNDDGDDDETSSSDHSNVNDIPAQVSENQMENQSDHETRLSDDGTSSSEDGEICNIEEILQQPKSWYSVFCNRWFSLFGAFMSITVMFLINWVYALANILAFLLIYLYTSLFNPGQHPGAAASFSFVQWIKDGTRSICKSKPGTPEQIVVTSLPNTPYTLVSTQLTQDNEDFANRVRFHQSAVGDYDYASLVADHRPLLVDSEHSN